MAETPRPRGLADTSVVVGPPPASDLPREVAVSALTIAELAAGTHAAADAAERSLRMDRLQRVEATFDTIAFDVAAARAYGRVYAAVSVAGRKPRGRRALDLLIAATAAAEGLPLYTRNPRDFAGLEGIVEVVGIA